MASKQLTAEEQARLFHYMEKYLPEGTDPDLLLVEKMAQVIVTMGDRLKANEAFKNALIQNSLLLNENDECAVDHDGCLIDNEGDAETDMEHRKDQ